MNEVHTLMCSANWSQPGLIFERLNCTKMAHGATNLWLLYKVMFVCECVCVCICMHL